MLFVMGLRERPTVKGGLGVDLVGWELGLFDRDLIGVREDLILVSKQ